MSSLVAADSTLARRADDVVERLELPTGAAVFEVFNPADGGAIARVPDSGPDDALAAVERAAVAGREWGQRTSRARADVLHAWYELLVDHADEIALLITREMGKTLAEARGEVAYGTDFVRWYAEEGVRQKGSMRDAPAGGATLLTRRSPVGLSVLVTPWNFPLAMATRKIAPALAAGCPVVIKPSEQTPLTTYFAVDLARLAGVPDQLVQVVGTTDPGSFSDAVLRAPEVRKVSFTGSTPVGRKLLRLAADRVLRSSMELGGNAPFVVFDDADLERAVDGAYAAKLRNGGQSCIAANRIFVQDGIADAFVEGLTERMASTVVGDGLGDGVDLGPLIDARAVQKVSELADDALERGAELLTGGAPVHGPGHFYAPTVLDRVPSDARIAKAEIFGPVAAIQRFSRQDDVLRLANDTELGLAAYVFTQDLDRAFDVAEALETGLVGINQGIPSNASAPFGGVKQSGLGREGSAEGLEEYQEVRMFNIARRQPRR